MTLPDTCDLSVFDRVRHGNAEKYGNPLMDYKITFPKTCLLSDYFITKR